MPDFPDLPPVDPAFRPPPCETDPESAAVLARLIEFGTEPPHPPSLPRKFQKAYDTVKQVLNLGRAARWNAFKEATKDFKQALELWREVDEAMSHTEDRTDTLSHRIFYRAEDALTPPPPLDWLVDGLLPAPSLSLLVGDPGTKKTFLAIDLAVCIASGKDWLGRKTQQSSAMLVDEETGLHQLWPRLNSCLRAHEAAYSTPLYFCSLGGYDLRSDADSKYLTDRALSFGAKLIVFDPLTGIMRGGDENNVTSMQPVVLNLRRMAEYCQAAVLLIHHNNRGGAFRGSSALSAGMDLMLSIESEPLDSLLQLRTLKSRHQAPPSFCAEAHFEPNGSEPRFWLTPAECRSSSPEREFRGVLADILDYLSQNGEATTPELVSQLSDNSPGTVRNAVHHLLTAGRIQRVNGTQRGTTAVFKLLDKENGVTNEQI